MNPSSIQRVSESPAQVAASSGFPPASVGNSCGVVEGSERVQNTPVRIAACFAAMKTASIRCFPCIRVAFWSMPHRNNRSPHTAEDGGLLRLEASPRTPWALATACFSLDQPRLPYWAVSAAVQGARWLCWCTARGCLVTLYPRIASSTPSLRSSRMQSGWASCS